MTPPTKLGQLWRMGGGIQKKGNNYHSPPPPSKQQVGAAAQAPVLLDTRRQRALPIAIELANP